MSQKLMTELSVLITAQNSDLKKKMSESTSVVKKAGESFKKMAGIMAAAFSAKEIVNFIKGNIEALNIQLKAERQVAQAVKNTGASAGYTSKQLFAMASGLQSVSNYGDEKILQDVTLQLLTFSNITEDVFERAQKAILDVATTLGSDLQPVSIQIGKALNDPVKGLSALARSGIQFTEQQHKLVKELVDTNKILEAQTLILDEIEKQYGGQAIAFVDPVIQAKNAWGDYREFLGKSFKPTLDSVALVFKDFINNLLPKESELLEENRVEFNAMMGALRDGLIPQERRGDFIRELNEKYKEYLPNLITEKSSIEDITKAQDAANLAFLKNIEIKAKEEILAEKNAKMQKAIKKKEEQGLLLISYKDQLKEGTGPTPSAAAGMSREEYLKDRITYIEKLIADSQVKIDELTEDYNSTLANLGMVDSGGDGGNGGNGGNGGGLKNKLDKQYETYEAYIKRIRALQHEQDADEAAFSRKQDLNFKNTIADTVKGAGAPIPSDNRTKEIFEKRKAEIKQWMEDTENYATEHTKKISDILDNFSDQANSVISGGIADIFMSLGDSIGKSLVGSDNEFATGAQKLLLVIFDLLRNLSALAISMGSILLLMPGAEGRGAALIIAGTAGLIFATAGSVIVNKKIKDKEEAASKKGMASSGVAAGGYTLVGEQGAEAVFLPQGARVVSHNDAVNALKGGGGNMNVHVILDDVIIQGDKLRLVLKEAERKYSNSL